MLRLYSRPGCHLCEQAEALLTEAGISVLKIDINQNEAAMRLYAFEIPVLTSHTGKVLLKGVFSKELLRLALKQ